MLLGAFVFPSIFSLCHWCIGNQSATQQFCGCELLLYQPFRRYGCCLQYEQIVYIYSSRVKKCRLSFATRVQDLLVAALHCYLVYYLYNQSLLSSCVEYYCDPTSGHVFRLVLLHYPRIRGVLMFKLSMTEHRKKGKEVECAFPSCLCYLLAYCARGGIVLLNGKAEITEKLWWAH